MSREPQLGLSPKEFWRGLIEPSAPALLIALGVCAAPLLALCLTLEPASFAGEKSRVLMIDDLDTHARAMGKAFALQQGDEPPPNVILLGTSTAERTLSGEGALAALIDSDRPPVVYNLCTDQQTSWEAAAIMDNVGSYLNGVLVIGVTPAGLGHGLSGGYVSLDSLLNSPRLGLPSPSFDEEVRRTGLSAPHRTGVYAVDVRRFLLARRSAIRKNLMADPPSYGDPMEAGWMQAVNNQKHWDQEIAALPTVAELFDTNSPMHLGVITRMAERVRGEAASAKIILMASPINPMWYDIPEGRAFHERYLSTLRHFAEEHDMGFLNIGAEAGLTRTDFVDYEGHISNLDAQRRTMAALAARVAEELAAEPEPEAAP